MDIRVAAGGGPEPGPRPIVYGVVSSEQPAPIAFSDPVFVVIPSHNAGTSIPLAWPAVHGSTKPVANMPVVLAYDDRGVLSVLGWGDSSTVFAGTSPTGAASGDLGGSFPNPTVTGAHLTGAVSATAPASPSDGQIWVYEADSTNGVRWLFMYNAGSASSHKWEFVGGGPLMSGPLGSITTASATLVALTSGPSITLPFAGDWEIGFSVATQQQGVAGANNTASTLIKNGVLTGIGQLVVFVPLGQSADVVQFVNQRMNGLAAADAISLAVENANSISTTFNNGALTVRPIRVG